jgi:AcrR family transcriptional regulator
MAEAMDRYEQIRAESEEKIVQTALELFARRGFVNTSVRMLAEEAGISQGLLYNYFESKQALLHAIFERSMAQVQEGFVAAATVAEPAQALAALIHSAFATVRDNAAFWRLTYQIRMQPEVVTGLGDQVGAWSEAIRSRIEDLLQGAGTPAAPLRARLLFAAIDGAAQHYVLDPVGYPLDEVAEELIALFAENQ